MSRELSTVVDDFDRLFSLALHPARTLSGLQRLARENTSLINVGPRVHSYVTDTHHVYRFDVPGVQRENLKVTVDQGSRTLTVSGQRNSTVENDTEEGGHVREVSYGSFTRTFTLPDDAVLGEGSYDAGYVDGVLTVSVNRTQHEQNTVVDVHVN